jgi:glycosyltransferase involved in cell wall biosynthesis
MRIALFTETFLPRVDGVTHTACQLLEHLARRGHASILFAPHGAPARYADTPVIPLEGLRFPPYPDFKLISPFVRIEGVLRDFAPDLIHALNPITLGLAAIRHARRLGVPVVASYHTDVPGFLARWGHRALGCAMQAYMRWVHNQADLNLCPSRVTMAHLERLGYKRLKVWSRGVDGDRFHPRKRGDDWRARLTDGETDKPLFVFVGRLSHEKRVHWIRPVFDALPGVRLAVVGDGPARPALQRLFASTPTVFTGALRGDDLAHAYASADAFVFPGANETLGNVVLEAMASGLPVIAPRAGGYLDFVIEDETALLFDPEHQDEMIAHMQRLAVNAHLARQLGAAGRARMRTCSWANVLDGLCDDYLSVIEAAAVRRTLHPAVSAARTLSREL